MDAQSYSLKQEHRKWIVCAEGKELMACADKRTALRIIKMAAKALKDSRILPPRSQTEMVVAPGDNVVEIVARSDGGAGAGPACLPATRGPSRSDATAWRSQRRGGCGMLRERPEFGV